MQHRVCGEYKRLESLERFIIRRDRVTESEERGIIYMASQLHCRLPRWWRVLLIAAVLLASDAMKHPKRPLIRAKESERVPNSYFVHIKQSANPSKLNQIVRELNERSSQEGPFKASVSAIVTRAAYGFSTRLSPEALDYVLRENSVEFVEEDSLVRAGSDPRRVFYAWGLDRIDQLNNNLDTYYTAPCNLTGEGVDVYVLDTGIHYSHVQFGGRAQHPGCDPADVESQAFWQFGGLPIRGRAENMTGWDCVGHGTHVAGIVGGVDYGVAPGVDLFSVRVLNCNLTGSWNAIVEGLDCVLERAQQRRGRPAIVNMSLFGEKTRAVKRAIEELLRHNITVVTIAGNSQRRARDSCRVTPGSVRGAITVAASTRQDTAWPMSNAGLCVDIFAPGEQIPSSHKDCNDCIDFKSGTSMAAPHVTGAIALLLQYCPDMPPWKVKLYLEQHMAVKSRLDMSTIPRKLRLTTPNLLLNLHHNLCSLHC